MKNARILLVGDYQPLLATRTMMLQDWNPDAASSSEALEKVHTGSYELIVIGQSVPGGMAIEIVSAAKRLMPPAQVIAIRFNDDTVDLGVETHLVDMSANPSWLGERVAFLLGNKAI